MYTMPLGQLLSSINKNYHFYADDSQLYLSFQHDNVSGSEAVHDMSDTINVVRAWMQKNKLMLNDNKTEFLVLSKRLSCPLSLPPLVISDCEISPVQNCP